MLPSLAVVNTASMMRHKVPGSRKKTEVEELFRSFTSVKAEISHCKNTPLEVEVRHGECYLSKRVFTKFT